MDLSEYIPTRVDAHHTKLVHTVCGRETYVQHENGGFAQGASLQTLVEAADLHKTACR